MFVLQNCFGLSECCCQRGKNSCSKKTCYFMLNDVDSGLSTREQTLLFGRKKYISLSFPCKLSVYPSKGYGEKREQSPNIFIWVNEDGSWEYSLTFFFAPSIRCLHFPVQLDRKRWVFCSSLLLLPHRSWGGGGDTSSAVRKKEENRKCRFGEEETEINGKKNITMD